MYLCWESLMGFLGSVLRKLWLGMPHLFGIVFLEIPLNFSYDFNGCSVLLNAMIHDKSTGTICLGKALCKKTSSLSGSTGIH